VAPTRSEPKVPGLDALPVRPGPERRAALTAVYDAWLGRLLPFSPGVALVATGGLGRREPAPRGDLDLMIVHVGQPVRELADAVWYPVWDAGLSLDHAVRTVSEAISVARDDLRVALALLDSRHVAGDPTISARLLEAARAAWRQRAPQQLAALREQGEARWSGAGELAYLAEPDLKEARGGLRDGQALRAVAVAQVVDVPWTPLRAAYQELLDLRDARQLATGRTGDVLHADEVDIAAEALRLPDGDALRYRLAEAGRTVAYAIDETWRSVDRWYAGRRRGWRRQRMPVRRPLAQGVVEQEREVVLATSAKPPDDPVLTLRVAAAAATADLPIARHTLARLAAETAPLPEPWPEEARNLLVTLLGAGEPLIDIWEGLDRTGLLGRLLPEWERVRSRPQRSPVHRYTVDRHLVQAAVEAAALRREVSRPDLLLLAALLHDIGKGAGGDHSEVGAELARGLVTRLGLPPGDAATVVTLVRHHLLLVDTATRRDLEDPETVGRVVEVLDSAELLDLAAALTAADAKATGPAAWTPWREKLVGELVGRARAVVAGRPLPQPGRPDPALVDRARAGEVVVEYAGEAGERVVAAAAVSGRRHGLLSRVAGSLALHRLDVLGATATTVPGEVPVVVVGCDVQPRYGELPPLDQLRTDLRAALVGELSLAERLAARDQTYGHADPAPARVLWDGDVVELRAADAPGLLFRVTAALESCGADVRWARVSTLGGDVVDAFGLASVPDRSLVAKALAEAAG
jgi:[protein-PII] uridylyltransferase